MNAEDRPKSKKKPPTRKPGRPRTPEDVRALVIRIAKETGWGYSRIRGEMRRLGFRLSRQTVKKILVSTESILVPSVGKEPGTSS
jgi:putative transposase